MKKLLYFLFLLLIPFVSFADEIEELQHINYEIDQLQGTTGLLYNISTTNADIKFVLLAIFGSILFYFCVKLWNLY